MSTRSTKTAVRKWVRLKPRLLPAMRQIGEAMMADPALGEELVDPRWVHVFGKKPPVTEVEELGTRWAPHPDYGKRVAVLAMTLQG